MTQLKKRPRPTKQQRKDIKTKRSQRQNRHNYNLGE